MGKGRVRPVRKTGKQTGKKTGKKTGKETGKDLVLPVLPFIQKLTLKTPVF